MKSERLQHRERLAKKRRFIWGADQYQDPKRAGMSIDTPTPCSCWMCGNPRKFFNEVSLQERSAAELLRRLG